METPIEMAGSALMSSPVKLMVLFAVVVIASIMILWKVYSGWKEKRELKQLANEIAAKPMEELRSWLFQYVILGEYKKVDELLNVVEQAQKKNREEAKGKRKGERFDLNRVNRTGTYMHMAARAGAAACVHVLVKHGADVNLAASNGDTALHVAAVNGQLETLRALLDSNADVNAATDEGKTALHDAAINGRHACVDLLLARGADVNRTTSARDWTAIHYAAHNAHYKALELLMAHGADINHKDFAGNTPLHEAARNGSAVCLHLFLDKAASMLKNKDGDYPIHIAAQSGRNEFVLRLVQKNPTLYLSQLLEMLPRLDGFHFRSRTPGEGKEKEKEKEEEENVKTEGGGNNNKEKEGDKTKEEEEEEEEEVFDFDDTVNMNVQSVLNYLGHYPVYLDVLLSDLTRTAVRCGMELLYPNRPTASLSESKAPVLQPTTSPRLCARIMSRFVDLVRAARVAPKEATEVPHFEQIIREAAGKLEELWVELDKFLDNLKDKARAVRDDDNDDLTEIGLRNREKGKEKENKEKENDEVGSVVIGEGKEQIFSKNLAERICPLIDAFYLLCSRCMQPSNSSGDNDRFTEFISRHAPVIREIARQKIELLVGSLEFILMSVGTHPEWGFRSLVDLLPFERKREWLRARLTEEKSVSTQSAEIVVSRIGEMLNQSCNSLLSADVSGLKGHFKVTFANENGVGPGVRREWFRMISKEMFNPDNGLFKLSAEGSTFQPNPHSYVNPDHLSYFEFVGRVIGLAIYHGEILEVGFTRSFYKHMLGIPLTVQDLESVDPEYYKNLLWILENDIEAAGLDLVFCADVEIFGAVEALELKPGAKDTPVTEENKLEYVQLLTELKLTKSIKKQIKHYLKGFHALVPRSLVSIFNEYELELLISGIPTIDIDDWEQNSTYAGGYTASSPQVVWFWETVRQLKQEDLALLLQFATGSSRVALGGFGQLRGMDGPQRFTLCKVAATNPDHLPTASTCFNLLKLPEYSTPEQLQDRLLVAIRCGSAGFLFS